MIDSAHQLKLNLSGNTSVNCNELTFQYTLQSARPEVGSSTVVMHETGVDDLQYIYHKISAMGRMRFL
jgi:hypothetical protein